MTIVATAAAESRYQELLDRFSAVFARIAEGSREREQRRILPFEQVQWLKEAGFTTAARAREPWRITD
ncbi:hypothetical protein AAHB37_01750 [Glutamicibacter halophytocola]|uniref:hypothetical protein n=1 Tax=Glutamicibacter halophytocola TaxID=1933880 RepID=UPI00321BA6B6